MPTRLRKRMVGIFYTRI